MARVVYLNYFHIERRKLRVIFFYVGSDSWAGFLDGPVFSRGSDPGPGQLRPDPLPQRQEIQIYKFQIQNDIFREENIFVDASRLDLWLRLASNQDKQQSNIKDENDVFSLTMNTPRRIYSKFYFLSIRRI